MVCWRIFISFPFLHSNHLPKCLRRKKYWPLLDRVPVDVINSSILQFNSDTHTDKDWPLFLLGLCRYNPLVPASGGNPHRVLKTKTLTQSVKYVLPPERRPSMVDWSVDSLFVFLNSNDSPPTNLTSDPFRLLDPELSRTSRGPPFSLSKSFHQYYWLLLNVNHVIPWIGKCGPTKIFRIILNKSNVKLKSTVWLDH